MATHYYNLTSIIKLEVRIAHIHYLKFCIAVNYKLKELLLGDDKVQQMLRCYQNTKNKS